MATKYLDYTGLSYFYSKLKTANEAAITTAINEALSEANNTFAKKTDLTNYYSKEEVDKLIDNISIKDSVSVKAIPLSTIEEICV